LGYIILKIPIKVYENFIFKLSGSLI